MIVVAKENKHPDASNRNESNVNGGSLFLGDVISKEELYSQGMKVLRDFFGIVNAEAFIALVKNEKYDYTEWRRGFYDKMTPDEYFEDVREFLKTNPYKGDPSTILKS